MTDSIVAKAESLLENAQHIVTLSGLCISQDLFTSESAQVGVLLRIDDIKQLLVDLENLVNVES